MPDLYWPDPDNLDRIKRRAEGFAKANVSAAMIFGTHFRWDYIPYLPLLHDYLATVAEELHSYGIKLYDHHSVNLVHRYDTREELRRVMTHSGPHLPFSPSREAAASWTYKGMLLNDWRMKDVRTGKPLYFPHYTAEGFCHRNPEFIYAYKEYLKELIADTGIDGLSADDGMYYMQYNACGCDHCRAELRRRAGIDLPPYYQFLKEMEEYIPAVSAKGYYSKSQNKYLTVDEASGPEADWLNEYAIVQYNNLFDEKDRNEVFFDRYLPEKSDKILE
jgi:hypothetical protein